jgi:hypothetical protein
MAVSTRRRTTSGELDELRAELAAARAEIAELRAAIRSTAALAVGIGFHRSPTVAGGVKTIRDVCGINGVDQRHADIITALFG